MPTDVLIGFDSAWTDKARAPGAISAMAYQGQRPVTFHAPRLATFAEALSFIAEVRSSGGATIVALDQPTIVPNCSGMRPVEHVAGSLVSWLGGGVQPSNRGKIGMFCDASPIWRFLKALGAVEDPEQARTATSGLHLIEVFPGLALASLAPRFFGRLAAPRYNPARRKTFRLSDWQRVAFAVAEQFTSFGAVAAAEWCHACAAMTRPIKADQDRLDSMLCLLVAMHWRFRPREECMMLGTLDDGYMIFPAINAVRQRIELAAGKRGVSAS